jgi:hypothetical protein
MTLMGLLDVAFIEYNNSSSDSSRADKRRLARAYVTRKYHERRTAKDGQLGKACCLRGSMQVESTVTTQVTAPQKQYSNRSPVEWACNQQSNYEPLDDFEEELECSDSASIPLPPTQHRFVHPMVNQRTSV